MKIIQKDDTVSSMEYSQKFLDSEDENKQKMMCIYSRKIRLTKHKIREKKSRLQQDIDTEILKALSSSNAAPDEDETFFISVILPLRKISEEEKLDFRMSVLQLIKYINNTRKERPVFGTTFSSASTSTSRNINPLSSLSAIMGANHAIQLPHLLQPDQFSYNPECSSISNVKTATAAGYIFQSV